MENPRALYVAGPWPGSTNLVRGSSRRITTMMASSARSTNIRVINRRNERLDRCPVGLMLHAGRIRGHDDSSRSISRKGMCLLDGSFHIRAPNGLNAAMRTAPAESD